jgi:hypothetical protein
MAAFVNYPLTTSDDDEFFDAPAGSLLIRTDADGAETGRYTKVGNDWDWQAPDGTTIQTGALWASFFADGNPFGDYGITPGLVLRVDLNWANAYGLAEDREAAEAAADARVAAWMAAAK